MSHHVVSTMQARLPYAAKARNIRAFCHWLRLDPCRRPKLGHGLRRGDGGRATPATLAEDAWPEPLLRAARSTPSHREEAAMPKGDKSAYTAKQKRKADHIEEGYEKKGVSEKEAEKRAWATVNKQDGGGRKSGSGRKG